LAACLLCLCTMGLFGVSSPQQFLILRHSKGGELLGGACIQVAFNLGNAMGAYCGGLPIRAGLSYNYPALAGACFVFLGVCTLVYFCRRFEPRRVAN
jgi:DHA1 family arabinose polymer transporter-like MFS transporter